MLSTYPRHKITIYKGNIIYISECKSRYKLANDLKPLWVEFTRQFETTNESMHFMIKVQKHFQFSTCKNKGGTD
jgi:hypothetical protein